MKKFAAIPDRIHGIAMSAYYGGRAECRIRRWPVPVVPVDLTSEYPSVDALLGIWDVLTAQSLSTCDATNEVRSLLARITLSDLFQPSIWKELGFYARIVPSGDILPIRSVYNHESGTCNIGSNQLHWKQPMWVAGPDLIASVLLGGPSPTVLEAFRLVPEGKQPRPQPVSLRRAVPVDPRTEDFFTRVIEYRKQNKSNDRLQHFLKILANSTAYGTYLELNPFKPGKRNRPKVKVHSGDQIFEQTVPDIIEQPGRFYFPLLGALITSGGRLLLAMIERRVIDAGGTYLCCDTDALTIVANKLGGWVEMPDGTPPVWALSWKEVGEITKRFDSLSPYERKIVPHLLRLTDENFDKDNNQQQLFGLSIAAKRYALYRTACGSPYCKHRDCITIIDPKAHGLIFFAPSDDREQGLPKWWWELWRFLLALEFRQIVRTTKNSSGLYLAMVIPLLPGTIETENGVCNLTASDAGSSVTTTLSRCSFAWNRFSKGLKPGFVIARVSSGFQGECTMPILKTPQSDDLISRFSSPVVRVTSASAIGRSLGSTTTPLRCVPPSHPERRPMAIAHTSTNAIGVR